ncbi:MAG: DUF192 domain-containing protein [Nitrospirae bacterium]|nr:MAG: DUF192 domain-containing protein [Nitrospirota bacterium]
MEKSQATRVGVLAVAALGLLLAGNYFMSANQGPEAMFVSFPSGARLQVEIADSPLLLYSGLAFRDSLPPGWGMLFIYDRADVHRRHTRQYRFPVDMIWLDEGKRVLLIEQNVAPCGTEQCPEYGPPRDKSRYVIETPAGFARREQLAPGADLRFTLQL